MKKLLLVALLVGCGGAESEPEVDRGTVQSAVAGASLPAEQPAEVLPVDAPAQQPSAKPDVPAQPKPEITPVAAPVPAGAAVDPEPTEEPAPAPESPAEPAEAVCEDSQMLGNVAQSCIIEDAGPNRVSWCKCVLDWLSVQADCSAQAAELPLSAEPSCGLSEGPEPEEA